MVTPPQPERPESNQGGFPRQACEPSFLSSPLAGLGGLRATGLKAETGICAGRESPQGRNQKGSRCCVRWALMGLSVRMQAGRGQPVGCGGLAESTASDSAVVGSSLLSSPGSLPKRSPLLDGHPLALRVSNYWPFPALLLIPTPMFLVATSCHCPNKRDHLVCRTRL